MVRLCIAVSLVGWREFDVSFMRGVYEWMDRTKKLDATDDAMDAPAAPRLLVLDAKTGGSLCRPMFIYDFEDLKGRKLGSSSMDSYNRYQY